MKGKLIAIVAVVLILTSCTSTRVDFGNGSFMLLGTRAEYSNIDEYQLISGSFPYLGEDMSFESWTCVDGEGIHLVAFLPTGQTFAQIDWDGLKLSYQSAFMPQGKFFAQYIVSDLQMCYASFDTLCDNFSDAGMSLVEKTVLNKKTRVLSNGKDIIETVVFEDGLITVENHFANYKYQIETL